MLAEQKSHLVNLENAATMLVDKYKSPQTQLEIKYVTLRPVVVAAAVVAAAAVVSLVLPVLLGS